MNGIRLRLNCLFYTLTSSANYDIIKIIKVLEGYNFNHQFLKSLALPQTSHEEFFHAPALSEKSCEKRGAELTSWKWQQQMWHWAKMVMLIRSMIVMLITPGPGCWQWGWWRSDRWSPPFSPHQAYLTISHSWIYYDSDGEWEKTSNTILPDHCHLDLTSAFLALPVNC